MTDIPSVIDLSVDVPGTPEEVWAAIATGPGVSSWYVPHTVEERAHGAAVASFGPTPEMHSPGRVAVWEPPHRIVFDDGQDAGGIAFEWTVEARSGGMCTVRLINSGFGEGGPWDDQYDAMTEGWKLFVMNLLLHRRHFPGQWASPALPSQPWPVPPREAFAVLRDSLGLTADASLGDRARTVVGAPRLSGTVASIGPTQVALILDEPAPGTAIVAAEGERECGVSVWCYLYGEGRETLAEQAFRDWSEWLGSPSRLS